MPFSLPSRSRKSGGTCPGGGARSTAEGTSPSGSSSPTSRPIPPAESLGHVADRAPPLADEDVEVRADRSGIRQSLFRGAEPRHHAVVPRVSRPEVGDDSEEERVQESATVGILLDRPEETAREGQHFFAANGLGGVVGDELRRIGPLALPEDLADDRVPAKTVGKDPEIPVHDFHPD